MNQAERRATRRQRQQRLERIWSGHQARVSRLPADWFLDEHGNPTRIVGDAELAAEQDGRGAAQ